MAISYSLQIGTSMPVAQAAGELYRTAVGSGLIDAATNDEQLLDPGVTTTAGPWVRMVDLSARPSKLVVDRFGFLPTVDAFFRFDKFGDFAAQGDAMVRIVAGLLDLVPGDMVLHYQYEDIWLLRTGATVTVSDRDDLWPPHRLAMLTGPYRREALSFGT